MKIDLSKIANPTRTDSNNLAGFISGIPVTIARRQSGWRVNMVISIGGVCVHDAEATMSDVAEWAALENAALNAQDKEREKGRLTALNSEAFKLMFESR